MRLEEFVDMIESIIKSWEVEEDEGTNEANA